LQFISKWFADLLQFFYGLTNNYGMAILLLTVTYRLVLIPLSWTQRKSMIQMKELAPKQKEIQEKYKDNPQEANKRILELYKEKKANPFSGCLVALLQLPIAIILFNVLRSTDVTGVSFLWIKDLSKPDLILVLLTGLVAYFQMSAEATDANKTTAITFPIFITFIGMTIASGVSLYLFATYVLSYAENSVMTMLFNRKKAGVEGGKQND